MACSRQAEEEKEGPDQKEEEAPMEEDKGRKEAPAGKGAQQRELRQQDTKGQRTVHQGARIAIASGTRRARRTAQQPKKEERRTLQKASARADSSKDQRLSTAEIAPLHAE